jgi:hypothetical protein
MELINKGLSHPLKSDEVKNSNKEQLLRLYVSDPYSSEALEGNFVPFHELLSNSLRKSEYLLFDKVLQSEVGKEVTMTLSFKLLGRPSEIDIVPKGVINDNYRVDPSMQFEIIVYSPIVK